MIAVAAIVAQEFQTSRNRAKDEIGIAIAVDVTGNQQSTSRTFDDGGHLGLNFRRDFVAHVCPAIAGVTPHAELHHHAIVGCCYRSDKVE